MYRESEGRLGKNQKWGGVLGGSLVESSGTLRKKLSENERIRLRSVCVNRGGGKKDLSSDEAKGKKFLPDT